MKFFSQKLKNSADFYTQIALMLVVVLLTLIIAALLPFRFDITEGRIYSISSVTKETLKNLDDVITVKAYFTEDLPGYLITVREQVRDILKEYKNYGQSKIRLAFLNPNKDSKIEQEAQGLGIPPLQFNVLKKDKFEVAQGYMGIGVLYGDKVETIPVVQNVGTLEFDLTSAIKKVQMADTLTVGILQKEEGTLPEEEFSMLKGFLERQYRVVTVDIADGSLIPEYVTTLLIPGPKGEYTDRELYAIDQFVMSGKGVIVFADGVSVDRGLAAAPNESNFFKLLKSYGVTVNKTLVFDSASRAQASFSQGPGQFFITYYGYWPKISSSDFNSESMLVQNLESLVLPWASTVTLEDAGNADVLVKTGSGASVVKDSFDLSPQAVPQGEVRGGDAVAVRIRGSLGSYFSEPVRKEGEETASEAMNKKVDQARLIVVGDADILTDSFLQRFESNVVFIQNLVDGFTLDESLATIRSKTVTERPIRELDDTSRLLVKYGNIVGVPLLVIVFAIMRFIWRRKSQSVGYEL